MTFSSKSFSTNRSLNNNLPVLFLRVQVNGCISTGKEANVYHANSKDGDMAVKIYKTSILVFKDRERHAR